MLHFVPHLGRQRANWTAGNPAVGSVVSGVGKIQGFAGELPYLRLQIDWLGRRQRIPYHTREQLDCSIKVTKDPEVNECNGTINGHHSPSQGVPIEIPTYRILRGPFRPPAPCPQTQSRNRQKKRARAKRKTRGARGAPRHCDDDAEHGHGEVNENHRAQDLSGVIGSLDLVFWPKGVLNRKSSPSGFTKRKLKNDGLSTEAAHGGAPRFGRDGRGGGGAECGFLVLSWAKRGAPEEFCTLGAGGQRGGALNSFELLGVWLAWFFWPS